MHLVGKLNYEDGNQTGDAILTSDSNRGTNWNDEFILKNVKIGLGTNIPGYKIPIVGTDWNNSVNGGGDIKIFNSSNVATGITLKSNVVFDKE